MIAISLEADLFNCHVESQSVFDSKMCGTAVQPLKYIMTALLEIQGILWNEEMPQSAYACMSDLSLSRLLAVVP